MKRLYFSNRSYHLVAALSVTLAATPLPSSAQDAFRIPEELKRLSIDELSALEITSVSRKPEPLWQAASAIDVITSDDIMRSGVTSIPDALRLSTGLHVAQLDGHSWGITARGFNVVPAGFSIPIANKMQVLMDGRNLYTPLFSGVFWDVQHTFLPDIQQIEVIRGPGATLWGANAVNGVINITTKSAKQTQGGVVFSGGGLGEGFFSGVRYGGVFAKNVFYRAYFTQLNRPELRLEGDGGADDEYALSRGGFRVDAELSGDDLLTLQGDAYAGAFDQFRADDVDVDGGNVIARWTRQVGVDSSLVLQAYYDRTFRSVPAVAAEERDTYDFEIQHRLPLLKGHDFIYGVNYRVSQDEIDNNSAALAFLPAEETVHLVSGYFQDEIELVPRVLAVVLGSKFEYNSFSGFEIQPSGRFIWTPNPQHTLWGAISRAVRTPTRVDQDVVVPNPALPIPTFLSGSRDFESEELIAYELGYRTQPWENISFDATVFYHDYSNLRSQEPAGPGTMPPAVLRNLQEGEVYGGSLRSVWRVMPRWEMEGSVTLLQTDIDRARGSRDFRGGIGEANDPNVLGVVRSSVDLPGYVHFDVFMRHVGELPEPSTPAYLELDARIGWWISKNVEIALVGRNLLDDAHPEFRQAPRTHEVRRSVYGTIQWRF